MTHPKDVRKACVMDFPTAWNFVRQTKPEQHHEDCSWRNYGGALLCDCHVLSDEYKRRESALSEKETS